MELMLTSFGLSHLQRKFPDTFQRASMVVHGLGGSEGVFDGMPPISISTENQMFMPEYPVLLLCDRLVMDAESFERLSKGEHHKSYLNIAEMMKALFNEGFIRVEDFGAIVDQNKELLERMLERDLKRLDDWVKPLKESTQTWQHFIESLSDLFKREYFDKPQEVDMDRELSQGEVEFWKARNHLGGHLHSTKYKAMLMLVRLDIALKSSTKRRRSEYRDALREALTEYLAYVNANLVLSHTLEVGFHDWYDFEPFYREKFLSVGQEGRLEEEKIQKVKQLFEVSFPEFIPSGTKEVLRVIKDKRIADLRNLVDKAVKEEIQFDREFANRVLQEVLGIEQRVGRVRNMVSYATLPLGLVPLFGTPMQKAVEEVVDRVSESRIRSQYRWFYLISELGRNKKHKQLNKKALSKED